LSLLTLSMLWPPVARECPNVGSGGGGGRGGFGGGGGGGGGAMSGKCYVCGGVGHLARECPSGGSGGGGDEGRCVQDVDVDIVVA
jgi:cellular nucleic acid-binding protein